MHLKVVPGSFRIGAMISELPPSTRDMRHLDPEV
jgi:hypothetical protein